jgi:hypothetical protein
MKIQYKDGHIQMTLTIKEFELITSMMNQYDCTEHPAIYKMLLTMSKFMKGRE